MTKKEGRVIILPSMFNGLKFDIKINTETLEPIKRECDCWICYTPTYSLKK